MPACTGVRAAAALPPARCHGLLCAPRLRLPSLPKRVSQETISPCPTPPSPPLPTPPHLQLCRQLGADGGRLALALCAGFAIPPHLLQAPIALTDWRTFQG